MRLTTKHTKSTKKKRIKPRISRIDANIKRRMLPDLFASFAVQNCLDFNLSSFRFFRLFRG